ncbi:hypothetical protein SYNPS1DRAFT_21627 [Syncephalis pseudoplumigaleata]|uniref:EF-hand domain-containing protein n=1 Tax=Syncephalis pseudoplumigaleata TaxID=1712513 RepID=A0A4P9Z2Q7_9FUNG|nr:hypothetical protein SYNPS1DRAFT_21627 [Syncephalis pseudoplumigaleata]|eukprot:RKP26655.1 hypothetical protein SYNPS1DRAFT_21627 [Syncephalis pseudoplumigaleata]
MRISVELCFYVAVGLVALAGCGDANSAPDVYGDIHAANEKMGQELHLEDKFTQEEDAYYFFNLNDRNNDGWLDGHELRAAFAAEEPDAALSYVDDWVERTLKSEDKDGE